MGETQLSQQTLASRCDVQQHFSAICLAAAPFDETPFDRALRQLDRAIVVELQTLRDRSHRWSRLGRHPLESEQELVLLRLDARSSGGCLAEIQKSANDIAQLC
ncbi:MAG TPA: hypothetical protein VK550_25625 [Polyangiaceae bacterium]|nr:hypothetical protein [Polyangiaceae bacterium]